MKKLLEELFAMYYQDVYRYLYSLSHDPSVSEDLTSEVFLEVVSSVALFRRESDIRTWIISIARHRWFHYLRKKKRQVPAGELPPEAAISGKFLELQYQNRETATRIMQLLNMESERVRKTIFMRAEGYSFREIGDTLGISEQSARVIHFRTKTKIQKILIKEGFIDG